MTTYSVTSGHTSTSLTLSNGDFLYVSSAGTATFTTVSDGGTAIVLSGGTTSFTTVSDGGMEIVSDGGTASSTTVDPFATQIILSGGSARFTTVSVGTEIVSSGGSAVSTTLDRDGVEDVDAGGHSRDTVVNGSGYVMVSVGGVATGTIVNDLGSLQDAGTASATVVNGGGIEDVWGGATAYATTVNAGGSEQVDGSTVGDTVYSGGAQTVLGGSGNTNGTTLSGGYQYVSVGGTAISTTVDNGGSAVAYGPEIPGEGGGGTITDAVVNSGGAVTISSGGSAVSTTVNSGGTEVVSSGGIAFGTTVNIGGAIDVAYLSYTAGGSAGVNGSDVLTVSVGGHSYAQQLAGSYTDVQFVLSPDTYSGTLVTEEAVPCFLPGTLILTDRGEIAVEALLVGDLVQTVLGGTLAPITWLGRREVDCAQHPHQQRVWPVCVAAGAFGPGRPHRALFLSPDHAVYVNSVLIPIRHLINATTIAQIPMDRVTYYHLELPHHDVLLAQGLPAESFFDLRDGSNYANRPGPARLYPDHSANMWEAFGCAPLVITGPKLDAARALVACFTTARQAA
jgi:autotransporter passenger strand-loop-strand repeat protein